MPLDANILNGQKSLIDQQQLQQAFEIKKALEAAQIQAAQQKALNGGDRPSAVQEYEYFNSLPTQEAKEQFINVKRANNPLNLGNTFAIRNPLTQQVTPLQGGTITAPPKVVDTGSGYAVTNPNNNTITPLAGGSKGLTPDQQREADLKTRESQDQFNRGLEVKQKALDAVNRLLANPAGVRANRGGISTRFPNVSDTAINGEADLTTLTNLLTTENLGLLKGVLSDTDMKVLASIGAGELAGSDEKVLGALDRMQKALTGKVAAAQQFKGQPGMPPLMSEIDGGEPIIDPMQAAKVGMADPNETMNVNPPKPSLQDSFDAKKYDSPEAIKAAYKSGKISKEKAKTLLQSKHGFE